MRQGRAPAWRALPLGFMAYVALALLLLRLLARGVPAALEAAISLVVLPVMYIFRPVYPLLDRLGLLEGDWWQMPSTAGFALATALYAAVLWAVTRTAARHRR
ncbi:MAG: hypothetical protein JNM38_04275 [Acidobacteria bacterium]|nr:hypothetical protein [Acidobacteriota bacterium]